MLQPQEQHIIGTLGLLGEYARLEVERLDAAGGEERDTLLGDRLIAVARICRDLAGYLEEPVEEEAQDIEVELRAYSRFWALSN